MEKEASKNIEIRLLSVEPVNCILHPEEMPIKYKPEDLRIGFSCNVKPDVSDNLINIVFGVRYMLNDKTLLECLYKFDFEVNELQNYVEKDDQDNIKIKHVMPHLLNVAVGTMRGILVVKTENTRLSGHILPMINATVLCSNLQIKSEK